MGNITTIIVFVWVLNALLFLSQASILAMNEVDYQQEGFYTCGATLIKPYVANASTMTPIKSGEIESQLPVTAKEVEEDSGIFILDAISTVTNWVKTQLNYIGAVVSAPYCMLKSIPSLPQVFAGTLALIWYAISIISIVALILGRNI